MTTRRGCPPPCCLLKCDNEEGLSPSLFTFFSPQWEGLSPSRVLVVYSFNATTRRGCPPPHSLSFHHNGRGCPPPCCLQRDKKERLFPSLFTFFSSSQREGCPPSLFFIISTRRGGHVPLLIYFLFNMMAGRRQSLQCDMEVNIHFLKVFASLLCHCNLLVFILTL